MTQTDYITVAGVIATGFGVFITWLVMKKQFRSRKLSYSYSIEPILRSREQDLTRDLKVLYQGEELPNPTLLSLDLVNVGLAAIEDAKVIVRLPDATYLIPGYLAEIPLGYEQFWSIEGTDAEECTIHFKHINPKQVARVRLLMDGVPTGEPRVSCPMPNVECRQTRLGSLGVVAEFVLRHLAPQLLALMRSRAY